LVLFWHVQASVSRRKKFWESRRSRVSLISNFSLHTLFQYQQSYAVGLESSSDHHPESKA
jgi:hypothetical protein